MQLSNNEKYSDGSKCLWQGRNRYYKFLLVAYGLAGKFYIDIILIYYNVTHVRPRAPQDCFPHDGIRLLTTNEGTR